MGEVDRSQTDLDSIVLAGIEAHWREQHTAPTLRELMIRIENPSFKNVHASLVRLRDAGKVRWNERQSRTLRVVEDVDTQQLASSSSRSGETGRAG